MKACGDLASLPVPSTAAAKETPRSRSPPSMASTWTLPWPEASTSLHCRPSAVRNIGRYIWPCCCKTLSHSSWIFISPWVAGLPTWPEVLGRGAANMSTTGRTITSARRQRPLLRNINVGFVRGTREVTFKSISAGIEGGSRPEPQPPCQEVLV